MTNTPDEDEQMLAVTLRASHTMTTSLRRYAWPQSAENRDKPVALLISHGMGQQVSYATLDAVAELLLRRSTSNQPPPSVNHVRFVDPDTGRETWLARAVLELPGDKEQKKRTVHLYETYWAPLTEGNISLVEVMQFLFSAGLGALRQRLKKQPPLPGKAGKGRPQPRSQFSRWLFGGLHPFRIPGRTLLGLLGALLLVCSLLALNTVLTLMAGASLLDLGKVARMPALLVDQLTLDLGWLLLLLVPAGLGLLLSQRMSRARAKVTRKRGWGISQEGQRERLWWLRTAGRGLLWLLLFVAAAALVYTTFALIYHYFTLPHTREACRAEPCPDPSAVREWFGRGLATLREALRLGPESWLAGAELPGLLRKGLIAVVWGLVAGLSWVLRGFLVQYMGDVAIYLDAYKVDKFHKVRDEIKKEALHTACVLYGARLEGREEQFAYDRIVLVGHSLGSVVTYDALNATLRVDESQGRRLRVAERTGGLITFGSPLDKTAYIFHNQTGPTSVRSPLAASVQPLLRDPYVRHYVPWTNIYSLNDPISGRLDFYDVPVAAGQEPDTYQVVGGWRFPRVVNCKDLEAGTPLLAHNQYWGNALLAETIREHVFDRRPDPPVWPVKPAAPVATQVGGGPPGPVQ